MKILSEIIASKQKEIADRKELYPTKLLEQRKSFTAPVVSIEKYLSRTDLKGIIAEIKRASPSGGIFHEKLNIAETSIGFMQAKASALSILSDNKFFRGSLEDLQIARDNNYCPILRKDFILDEYQIIEAKAYGADCILLIAKILSKLQLRTFTNFAKSLRLSVLIEAHDKEELNTVCEIENVLYGVNSRNLDTLEFNHDLVDEALSVLPKESIKVAESGIRSPERVRELRNKGYLGFLIGEQFMRSTNPTESIQNFISKI
jgi:indole-3-glycerol phosphate synthase